MATSRQLREQIAAGRWDAALAALYGGSEEVLSRQRSRYGAALEQFELYYGPGRQVQVYSAPGRTELGGNHTDHQHGYGLAGAVTLDLVAVASRNEDGFIRVKSRGFNKLDVIDLTEAEPQQGESTHSASLIRGIAEGFRAKGCDVGGFDAYTASDVLRGSGLSSSAAFEMGVAIILNTEYGCGLDAPALARICQFAENTYFGKPSGLLDQLTSAVGGVLFADFADPTAPKIEKIHADGVLPEGMTLCVTDTRASHSELPGCVPPAATARCCVPSTILRRMPVPLPREMLLWQETLPPLPGWWRRAATRPLSAARMSTVLLRRSIRGCRRRWLSARASFQAPAVHGGCRAAALPERSRLLYRMR